MKSSSLILLCIVLSGLITSCVTSGVNNSQMQRDYSEHSVKAASIAATTVSPLSR